MKGIKTAVVLALALVATGGVAMGGTIDVGDADFEYGHNVGSFGGFSDADVYDRSGGFFEGGRWYLNPGTTGYMVYKFEADPGYTMDEIDLSICTYFEASSWISVFYRTTDYTGDPDFNDGVWTSLGYSYVRPWTTSFSPDSQVVYLGYGMGNAGSYAWQCQLQYDSESIMVTPEPATMSLLAVGGLLAVRRKRR
jgi:hypothetical protein